MRSQNFAAGMLGLVTATVAFSDSSPLVLVSTKPFASAPTVQNIQTSSQALTAITDLLDACPTENYLLISQPGLQANDLRQPSSQSLRAPNLQKLMTDSRVDGTYTIPEVLGGVSSENLFAYIDAACNRMGQEVTIKQQHQASLPSEGREHVLAENDALLVDTLRKIEQTDSFTVLLFATPLEPTYEADFGEPVRMDLKRELGSSQVFRRDDRNSTWDKLPLFEKYQFFTPGIFMAVLTAIILFSVLYIGLSALSSLEVSYAAFEKDMGPATQKKQ